ncbi:hypothetical protein C5S32_04600 [ANME-1 cluster archaeon GoMg1]|nr:hypothetical protein [ANME-1 cluster archaeon GoMg1]
MLRCFAISRARVGSGGEVYIGAEGVRENRGHTWGEGRGERYSYEEPDTVPVVVVDEEKKKVHKTWYITLYNLNSV